MNIYVCVGSSCHLKGSYAIIELMKEHIAKNNLTETVKLSAAFCLGKCASASVSVKFNDEVVTGVTPENFEEIFNQYVIEAL